MTCAPTQSQARDNEPGRFASWPTSELAAQCRMQARENLDPEYSQFMAAVAERLSSTPPASPSVVADKPDAGEVTQEDRDRAAAHIRSQSSHRTDEHFAKLIETGQRDQAPFLRVIAEVRHAAHEAGKREGLEMGACIPDAYADEQDKAVKASAIARAIRRTAIRALSQQEEK